MLLALILTVRTAAVKGHPADPTVVIVGHPEPGGNPVPLFDFHLHPADLTGAQTHHTGAANASTMANVDTRSLNISSATRSYLQGSDHRLLQVSHTWCFLG